MVFWIFDSRFSIGGTLPFRRSHSARTTAVPYLIGSGAAISCEKSKIENQKSQIPECAV